MAETTDTKRRLLEAACAVFRENGYAKSKVSDIVSAANVAQGTFYLYFKSKKDCLNMLVAVLLDNAMADMRQEHERLDRNSIYRVVDMIVSTIKKHKEILTIMHFEQGNLDKHIAQFNMVIQTESRNLIRSAFIARGVSERSAEIKSRLMDSVIKQYLIEQVYIFNPAFRYDREDFEEMLRIIVDDIEC